MSLPGFTAEASHPTTASRFVPRPEGAGSRPAQLVAARTSELVPASSGELVPQFRVCTPCVGLPAGNWCFTIFGRRICLPIPNVGRWRGCCEVRVFPPGISNCGVARC